METFNHPLFAWCIVTAVIAIIVMARIFNRLIKRNANRRHRPILGIARESEELFVPGDISLSDKEYSDDFVD